MSKNPPEYPSYVPLRVGADWSSAIRDQLIYFQYADGEIQITDDTDSVHVATAPSTRRRPAVTRVVLHVESKEGDIHTEIDPYTCSALFWTESAVEKFLLPYYASAAGPDAYAVMYAIIRAWYHYDEKRPVVALAFSYAPVDSLGLKSLWNTVDVIYVEDRELKQLPLLHFLPHAAHLELPKLPRPIPLDEERYRRGRTKHGSTPIDRLGARHVAEYVSGLRGQEVRVYEKDGEGGLEPMLTSEPVGKPLFEAFCPYVRKGRPPVTGVELMVEEESGRKQWHPLRGPMGPQFPPDSVFWTDGAVETLLLPYYAAVQGASAPWGLEVLLGKWAGSIPAKRLDPALLWEDILLNAVREMGSAVGGRPVEPTAQSAVFAIIHLPNSDWVDEQGNTVGNTVGNNIALPNRLACVTAEGAFPLVSPTRPLVRRRAVRARAGL
jgi:hypothetical protein